MSNTFTTTGGGQPHPTWTLLSHICPMAAHHKIRPLAQVSQELGRSWEGRGERASPQGDSKASGARRLCGHKLQMSSSVRKLPPSWRQKAEAVGQGHVPPFGEEPRLFPPGGDTQSPPQPGDHCPPPWHPLGGEDKRRRCSHLEL